MPSLLSYRLPWRLLYYCPLLEASFSLIRHSLLGYLSESARLLTHTSDTEDFKPLLCTQQNNCSQPSLLVTALHLDTFSLLSLRKLGEPVQQQNRAPKLSAKASNAPQKLLCHSICYGRCTIILVVNKRQQLQGSSKRHWHELCNLPQDVSQDRA